MARALFVLQAPVCEGLRTDVGSSAVRFQSAPLSSTSSLLHADYLSSSFTAEESLSLSEELKLPGLDFVGAQVSSEVFGGGTREVSYQEMFQSGFSAISSSPLPDQPTALVPLSISPANPSALPSFEETYSPRWVSVSFYSRHIAFCYCRCHGISVRPVFSKSPLLPGTGGTSPTPECFLLNLRNSGRTPSCLGNQGARNPTKCLSADSRPNRRHPNIGRRLHLHNHQ